MKELTSSEITELVFKEKPYHWELWRQNNTAIHGRKFIGKRGIADITGYSTLTGQRIEIEVKKKGDKLSDEQAEFLIHVAKCGGISYIAMHDSECQLQLTLIQPNDTLGLLNIFIQTFYNPLKINQ